MASTSLRRARAPSLALLGLTVSMLPLLAQGTAERRDTLRIALVGDINFARSLARDYILSGRGAEVFAGVQDRLRAADIAVGNLESLILERGTRTDPTNSPVFAGPVQGIGLMQDAGFDAVSTANNHSWDFGRAGLLESISHLERAGLPYTGTGSSAEAAWRPAVIRSRGWTVAIFGITAIINHPSLTVRGTPAACCIAWADTLVARERFRAVRDSAGADLVIAFVHHGWVEYVAEPDLAVVELFRGLARAGADAVVGHHPHVPQGWERLGNVPLIYSLGNFVFRQFRPWTDRGIVAELLVTESAPIGVSLLPVAAGYTPYFLSGPDSAAVIAHVDSISRRIGLPNRRARRNVARPSPPLRTPRN